MQVHCILHTVTSFRTRKAKNFSPTPSCGMKKLKTVEHKTGACVQLANIKHYEEL